MNQLKEMEVLFSNFLESDVCDAIHAEMFEGPQDICNETFWSILRIAYTKGYLDALPNYKQENDSQHLLLVKNS